MTWLGLIPTLVIILNSDLSDGVKNLYNTNIKKQINYRLNKEIVYSWKEDINYEVGLTKFTCYIVVDEQFVLFLKDGCVRPQIE